MPHSYCDISIVIDESLVDKPQNSNPGIFDEFYNHWTNAIPIERFVPDGIICSVLITAI